MGKGKPRHKNLMVTWIDRWGKERETSMFFFQLYNGRFEGAKKVKVWDSRTGEEVS